MNIFAKDRNAPCICGSGKKYKKCCLFTLEKLQRQWDKNKYVWLTTEMAFVLALVCGLPQREAEKIPAVEEIEAALDYINESLYQTGDDRKSIDNLTELIRQFEMLLLDNPFFADIRFSDETVVEYLDMVEEHLGELGDEPEREVIEEVFEAYLEEYLPRIVDEDMSGCLVLDLIHILRKEHYDLEERAAVLNAIDTCLLEPSYDNPIWEAVLRTSVIVFLRSIGVPEEGEYEQVIPERSWPIVKVFIPEQECWNIGGVGSAGIVQQQADGRYCLTMYYLELPVRKITLAWSEKDLTEEDLKKCLADMWKFCPPWEEGTLDKAARYIWGVYAWAITEGIGQEDVEPYLEVIPQPKGEQKQWLQDLLWGGELINPKLIKTLVECGRPQDLPEGKEYFILTIASYRISNPPRFITELSRFPDYEIEEIVPGEEWSILRLDEYPEGAEPQLEGVENIRRVLANCRLVNGVLQIEGKTLTMIVRIVQELKHYTSEYLTYEGVTWTSYQEMLRKIKKQGKRRKAPVKKKQAEKLF